MPATSATAERRTDVTKRKEIVEEYFEGFRRRDHARILGLLTDDVMWDLPGFKHLEGKEAFDGEIENEAFEGSPTLVVDRLVEEGDTVVAIGTGQGKFKDGPVHKFAYCDVFTFTGDAVNRVESYVVALP
jgi:ketosteroid isomerase-like protein